MCIRDRGIPGKQGDIREKAEPDVRENPGDRREAADRDDGRHFKAGEQEAPACHDHAGILGAHFGPEHGIQGEHRRGQQGERDARRADGRIQRIDQDKDCLLYTSPELQKTGASVSGTLNAFRVIFFLLTFFTIGMVSNFRKLMEEGIGRLAIVYVVCLFGFIIWLGLLISWLFFNGITPPLAS